MPTLVLKLFAGQGTGRTDEQTDGQSGDYMFPLWRAYKLTTVFTFFVVDHVKMLNTGIYVLINEGVSF